jgi:hypothetical protein
MRKLWHVLHTISTCQHTPRIGTLQRRSTIKQAKDARTPMHSSAPSHLPYMRSPNRKCDELPIPWMHNNDQGHWKKPRSCLVRGKKRRGTWDGLLSCHFGNIRWPCLCSAVMSCWSMFDSTRRYVVLDSRFEVRSGNRWVIVVVGSILFYISNSVHSDNNKLT